MDRTDDQLESRKPTPRTVGIIGKRSLNPREKAQLRYVGRCIARLGHTLGHIPTKGASEAVVKGVEVEGGATRVLDGKIIETVDRTVIYPDDRLLARLLHAYPDLTVRDDVMLIYDGQLPELVNALNTILTERHIALPT